MIDSTCLPDAGAAEEPLAWPVSRAPARHAWPSRYGPRPDVALHAVKWHLRVTDRRTAIFHLAGTFG